MSGAWVSRIASSFSSFIAPRTLLCRTLREALARETTGLVVVVVCMRDNPFDRYRSAPPRWGRPASQVRATQRETEDAEPYWRVPRAVNGGGVERVRHVPRQPARHVISARDA